MSWKHREIDIELDDACFTATVGKKKIRTSSLAAAKKAIDKEFAAKAATVDLRLPLLNFRFDNGKEIVTKHVLIGLDPTTLEPQYEGDAPNRRRGNLFPDDEESLRVCREFEVVEAAYEKAKDARCGRLVSTWFDAGRKSGTTYARAIEQIQARYAAAKAGRA